VFAGSVLDAGCGLGENTLHIASLGLPVLGIDVAETALAAARKKTADLGIEVEFATADAFHLKGLGCGFQTILDSGLFHSFEDEEQLEYAASLASVTRQGGSLYVLCFSDEGPDPGPHPVHQEQLKTAFSPENGWKVIAVESERIETIYHANGVSAWLVTVRRI
jgi:SAM-dependent methyltransferase